jgi:hypothetical protein
MGLKIADLLRWRTSVELKDENGKPILDNGKPVVVYLRVIGDQDLQDAYRIGRVHSSDKRKKLRDKESLEFKDQVEPIREASKEECIDLIKTARQQNLNSQAYANVTRPDLVKLDEVAADPDAPTLEEQEKLDAENTKIEEDFRKALDEYVETKTKELNEELDGKSIEELREIAELEVSNITSLALFLQEVQDYKMTCACYNDKQYREKSFDSIDDYRATHPLIKEQLIEAYNKLEMGVDEVKN